MECLFDNYWLFAALAYGWISTGLVLFVFMMAIAGPPFRWYHPPLVFLFWPFGVAVLAIVYACYFIANGRITP